VEGILCLYRDWATLKNIGRKITLTLNDIGVKVLLAVGVRSLPLLKHQEDDFCSVVGEATLLHIILSSAKGVAFRIT
jgi:hypothetical protein